MDTSAAKKVTKERQVLKCCDDRFPFYLFPYDDGESKKTAEWEVRYQSEDRASSWLGDGSHVDRTDLRARIEPWLTALFQSEHLNLLLGSGLPSAVYQIAGFDDTSARNMDPVTINCEYSAQITAEATRAAKAMNRGNPNIEDVFRAANDLLRGLEIFFSDRKKSSAVDKRIAKLREEILLEQNMLIERILQEESKLIAEKNDDNDKHCAKAIMHLVGFLVRFASRIGTRERLHIFTTNYDRCIEIGADLAGLRLIDRFVGTLSPVFRSSRLEIDMHYNPPGIRGEPRYLEGVARYTKLHGSLDWFSNIGMIRRISLPFGAKSIEPYLQTSGAQISSELPIIVYPNSVKDWETAFYPYVDLFRDFAAAICRPNTTLFCYGYGFGDQHINRIILDMLTIPSTHLVIISRMVEPKRLRFLKGYWSQITLLIGSHLGNLMELNENYLPLPASNEAMSNYEAILKARIGTTLREKKRNKNGDNCES